MKRLSAGSTAVFVGATMAAAFIPARSGAWTGVGSKPSSTAEISVGPAPVANNCEIPFVRSQDDRNGFRPFATFAAINQEPGVDDVYRNRYLVANLNSVGDDGLCKGVQEHYPGPDDLSLFPDLAGSPAKVAHYRASVARYWTQPFSQTRTIRYRGQQLCVGQTISLCELRRNRPIEIARFVTSGLDYKHWLPLGPRRGYYAPINVIQRRSWEAPRPYTAADEEHDSQTGGVAAGRPSGATVDRFRGVIMPNFLNFAPLPGYWGESRNGIHRRVNTEGPGTEDDLGVPASLGCLRVTWYASRLARWWTPYGARLFIHFEPENYVKEADASGRPARAPVRSPH